MMAIVVRALSALLMLLSFHLCHAQGRVHFCSNYTAAGEPSGTSYSWEIDQDGGIVSLLYKSDGGTIASTVVYIYIDKREGDYYTQVGTKRIVPGRNKSWVAYDHTFSTPGNYRVTVLDQSRKELATGFCSVVMKRNGLSSAYYSGSKVKFCGEIAEDGTCKSELESFTISENGSYADIVVEHTGELKTTSLIIDVYTGEYLDEFVETVTVTVEESWTWAKFQYTFYTPGKYKFKVYNNDEVFINSAVGEAIKQ